MSASALGDLTAALAAVDREVRGNPCAGTAELLFHMLLTVPAVQGMLYKVLRHNGGAARAEPTHQPDVMCAAPGP